MAAAHSIKKYISALQDHEELSERLRKTFYYGKQPTTDRPSLPLTSMCLRYKPDIYLKLLMLVRKRSLLSSEKQV